MSLKQRIRLELEDGTEVETEYDGRDLRAWEAEFEQSALGERLSVSMLTWLGHHAAIRRGDLNGAMTEYEAFDKVCVSVQALRTRPTKEQKGKKARAATPKDRGEGSSAP